MTSSSKIKGSQWERDVVAYLRDHGFPWAERRYGAGAQADRGDINAIPGVVLEAKAAQRIELAGWMDELGVEMVNADAREGFLVVKRRRATVGAAYVIESLAQFCGRERDDAMVTSR